MPSKFKARLRRNRRRQRALVRKTEQLQESVKIILAEADQVIVRLEAVIASLDKARTAALIRTLASVKN